MELKRTPLYEAHLRCGGKMVEFGGFEMPVQYKTGVIREHMAVRTACGLFDVSHMGEVIMEGPDATEQENGIKATLPEGIREDDILGISAEGDTLLVNLSENFREAIRENGAENETLLCYSMVNTLCLNTGLRRVCFFFEGEQTEWIAGEIYWAGEFLYNPEM